MRVVSTGFEMPWEISTGPDGWLWVTERLGKRVVRVNPQTGTKQVAVNIPEALAGGQHLGVLGMALHPDLLRGVGRDWVYVTYTYGSDADEKLVHKRIVRYTFDKAAGKLTQPTTVIENLPGGLDHNGGRLKFGPDGKLYLSFGELGHNQLAHVCKPIRAQEMPSAADIAAGNYDLYVGKTLRLNVDGSIPTDNPSFDGVRSHIYTVGHRNTQGLAFGQNGLLYSSEQGPNTDDEINILAGGKNYGWPHIAGYQDDQAYAYANWSAAPNCETLEFNYSNPPAEVPVVKESEYDGADYTDPLMTFWTRPKTHDFSDVACEGWTGYLCNPTTAPSSIDIYEKSFAGIPHLQNSLLMTSLKDGAVYQIPLSPSGQNARGQAVPLPGVTTVNRYRDLAFSPDQRTIYVATDSSGSMLMPNGQPSKALANPGAILAFTYTGN
ncbi:hypothetical protein GCM10017783_12140 [Deinococcus piscis]|uniref:Glucose/Sorbosone dehydrogenase domain-containing protein n=2 Tax=Deinococcus piscis TaxID=394230 RepID=A0ABQ3K460_9DEIO|nr:hypothetical protein GCM10017783_12140 [Deinococcus piscis]